MPVDVSTLGWVEHLWKCYFLSVCVRMTYLSSAVFSLCVDPAYFFSITELTEASLSSDQIFCLAHKGKVPLVVAILKVTTCM